ncbi:MAG TPA: BBP7 family outer membrane beta-barrel protein [Gemmataceae bacterium]|nr:BBP7 family outer membrane beta-barrel protein [Gemmataceae bacterium]
MKFAFAGGLILALGLWAATAYGQAVAGRPALEERGPYAPLASAGVAGVPVPGPSSSYAPDPARIPAASPAGLPPAGRATASCEPSCGDCFGAFIEPCGPPGRVWLRAEYLLWWIRDSRLPPLLTAGTPAGLAILGQPGTTILFGGDRLDNDERSGARFSAGTWLNCCQTCGLEVGGFFLGKRSIPFAFECPPDAIVGRPFFDVPAGAQAVEFLCVPPPGLAALGILPVTGNFRASSSSRLWGLEANAIKNVCCGPCYRFDLLGGFRYLQLDEDLAIIENVQVLPNDIVPDLAGTRFALTDIFDTRNQFYGGQLGGRLETWRGRWFLNVLGKVALGVTHQVVGITGSTTITTPGVGEETFPGGLLALRSNICQYTRDRFAVVPEVGVNVGYQLTSNLRGYVGYTFLYWSDVVRPGDQINLRIDPRQLPPAPPIPGAAPVFRFNDTDFHAHGINFGLEFRF